MPDLESFNRKVVINELIRKKSLKRIGNKRMRNPNVYDIPSSPNKSRGSTRLKTLRKSNPVRRKPTDQVKKSGRKTLDK